MRRRVSGELASSFGGPLLHEAQIGIWTETHVLYFDESELWIATNLREWFIPVRHRRQVTRLRFPRAAVSQVDYTYSEWGMVIAVIALDHEEFPSSRWHFVWQGDAAALADELERRGWAVVRRPSLPGV